MEFLEVPPIVRRLAHVFCYKVGATDVIKASSPVNAPSRPGTLSYPRGFLLDTRNDAAAECIPFVYVSQSRKSIP